MADRGISTVRIDGTDYYVNDPNIANEFATNLNYNRNELVTYQGKIYRFLQYHPAGAWNADHVINTSISFFSSVIMKNRERFACRIATYDDLDMPWHFNTTYPTSTIYMYEEDGDHYMSMDIHGYPGQRVWIDQPSAWSDEEVYVTVFAYNEDYTQMQKFTLRSDNMTLIETTAILPQWTAHAYLSMGNTSATVTSADSITAYYTVEKEEEEDNGVYYNPVCFENGQFNGDQLEISWTMSNGTKYTSNPVEVKAGDIVWCESDDYQLRVFTFSDWASHSDFTCTSRSYDRQGKYLIVKKSGTAVLQMARKDGEEINVHEKLVVADLIRGVKKRYDGDIELVLKIEKDAADFYAMFESEIPAEAYEKTKLGEETSIERLPIYLYKITRNDQYVTPDYELDDDALGYRKKVLVTGSVHGNEKMSSTAVTAFVKNLLYNKRFGWMLGKYEFYVVPLVNPWGYGHHIENPETHSPLYQNQSDQYSDPEAGYIPYANTDRWMPGIRPNYERYNINRDFSDHDYDLKDSAWTPTITYGFKTVEAALLRDLMSEVGFDFVIDVHQHVYDRNIVDEGAEHRFSGMCGQTRAMSAEPDNKTTPFSRANMEGCSAADAYLAKYVGYPPEFENMQMSFLWSRPTNGVSCNLRNYSGGYHYTKDGVPTGNLDHQEDIHADYGMTIEVSQHCQTLAYARNVPHNVFTMIYSAVYVTELINALLRDL